MPGVGAIFIGAGGDLHQYLGVPQDSPEVEHGRQTILAACKAHYVACGITALTKADVRKRLKVRMEDDSDGPWRVIAPSKEGGGPNPLRHVVCVPVGFAGPPLFPDHTQHTEGTPPVAARQMGQPQTRYVNFVLI